jgi:hypothetical protein
VDLFNAGAKRPIGKPVIGKWHLLDSLTIYPPHGH